jgi:cell division protein FtsN
MRDEEAPWLAEAAPLRAEPRKRPLLNIVIAVLALGAVAAVALLMLLGRRDSGSSQGYMEADQAPLIEADAGPFKIAPTDRQGMAVEGEGEVIHEAVRGQDPGAVIDMGALPEEPVGRPRDLLPPGGAPPAQMPAPAGQPVPVQVMPAGPAAAAPVARPAPPKPVLRATNPAIGATKAPPVVSAAPAVASKAPAAASATVQIGAFSSEAKAQEEWARVAAKGGLTGKRIEKLTSSSGKTLWRVRGTAADPDAACKAILAAKGACEVKK